MEILYWFGGENLSYISHSGVKGMKWGVRKIVKKSINKVKNPHYSKDYRQTRKLRRKNSKYLSNQQLKTLNKRMELEQKYNQLSTKSIHRGFDYVRTITSSAAAVGGLYFVYKSPYFDAGKTILKQKVVRRFRK